MGNDIKMEGTPLQGHILGVGEGWRPILKDLHEKLVDLVGDYSVFQIKEKFGTLRAYLDPPEGTDEETWKKFRDLVYEAEGRSATTCERCGDEGKLRSEDRYWVLTLCDSCDNIE